MQQRQCEGLSHTGLVVCRLEGLWEGLREVVEWTKSSDRDVASNNTMGDWHCFLCACS